MLHPRGENGTNFPEIQTPPSANLTRKDKKGHFYWGPDPFGKGKGRFPPKGVVLPRSEKIDLQERLQSARRI